MPSRRHFLKLASGVVLIPLVNINDLHANQLEPLQATNPQAQALKYVEVSEKEGQRCDNCLHYVSATQGCNIFPGKSVAAAGWCAVWAIKPA